MNCSVCNSLEVKSIFGSKILKKYNIKYYQCMSCGAVFTEKPYWLSEAYAEGESVATTDTGIMRRNINHVINVNVCIKKFFESRSIILDWGGGHGILTRLLRDLGYNCQWYDKYTPNLMARGFEWDKKTRVELVTLMEVFEHLEKPLDELKEILNFTDNILIGTLLYGNDFSYRQVKDWWYYDIDSGQHILFCSKVTMSTIADILGLNYYYIDDSLHLFTKKKLNRYKVKIYMVGYVAKIYKNILWFWMERQSGQYSFNDYKYLIGGKYDEG